MLLSFAKGFLFLMRQTIIVMSRHIEFDEGDEIMTSTSSWICRFIK